MSTLQTTNTQTANTPSPFARTHHNIPLAVICGECRRPLAQHGLGYESLVKYEIECDRSSFEPTDFDYFLVSDHGGLNAATHAAYAIPYFDHSGNASSERLNADYDRNDEYDYESYDSIWEPVDRWTDTTPEVHTHVLGEQPNPAYSEFIEPELRNAYVEGNDAFLSLQVLDLELTRKYHARLLNWFLTKEGEVRVGSMRFGINEHGERFVQCVRACCKDSQGNWYKPGTLIDNYSHSREAMEDLVVTIITHGNNCAASFIRNRADWYAIGTPEPRKVTEDFNAVEFVLDHQRYCKDARCKCAEWLASEVPAFTATA